MNSIELRFNTMLNFCYMLEFEENDQKRKEILKKMSEYLHGENHVKNN